LKTDFAINNERQDCETGTVYVCGDTHLWQRDDRGDEDEAVRMMGFIYIQYVKQ
jgi:hypothetical protein